MKPEHHTHILILLAAVAAVQLLTLATSKDFYLTQLTMTAYYSLIIIGLCLLMGYAGQISLGHAGFFAIGGYTSAVLTTTADKSSKPARATKARPRKKAAAPRRGGRRRVDLADVTGVGLAGRQRVHGVPAGHLVLEGGDERLHHDQARELGRREQLSVLASDLQ